MSEEERKRRSKQGGGGGFVFGNEHARGRFGIAGDIERSKAFYSRGSSRWARLPTPVERCDDVMQQVDRRRWNERRGYPLQGVARLQDRTLMSCPMLAGSPAPPES